MARIGQQHTAIGRALARNELMTLTHEAVGQVSSQGESDQADQLHGSRQLKRG
jgi:hypothetical protein